MATIAKEEVPTGTRRQPPGGTTRGRMSWRSLAVVLALLVGIIGGAAEWQAAGAGATGSTTTDPTASTRKLAQRFVAAGLWSQAQAGFFAPLGSAIDEATGNVGVGSAQVANGFRGWYDTTQQRTEKLVVVGQNRFVTEFKAQGARNVTTGQPFTMHGVVVITVKAGKITRYDMYFDPTSVYGYTMPVAP